MWPFKKKEDEILKKSVALITDTVDIIMEKSVDLYTSDNELRERASEEKLLDISIECMIFLTHILDLNLYRKRADVRESIMRSLYRLISGAYDLDKIDGRAGLRIENIIDDRMGHYAAIVRGVWRPAGYWWFGQEMKQEPLIQCFALFGDYITYYRECGSIPIGDDIESVLLVNPLDCETLAVPFIVFQYLSPAVNQYIEELQTIVR